MVECLLAMVLTWAGVAAQQPPQQKPAEKPNEDQTTFIVTPTLVNVPLSVLDAKDRLVIDLKKENFTVYEDNKKVDVRFFTAITKVPLRVGLLIDTSNSVRLYFKQQQEAANDFIHSILEDNAKNRLFLMSFDFTKDFVTGFSDDADMLTGKVRKLKAGGGTALNDAIILACQDKLAKEAEIGGLRRVLVLITDGEDDASKHSLDEAISVAKHSNVTIFSIATIPYGYTGEGEKALEKLASETGGRVVYPWKKPPSAEFATGYLSQTQIDGSNSVYGLGTGHYSSETAESLALSLSLITRELHLQYSLAYNYIPPNPDQEGHYRQLRVEVNVPGLKVHARKGYYPPMLY